MGQEHQGDGDNVGRNKNVYYASEKHTVQPKLTTKLGKDTIIGREKELQEIDERLNNSNSLLLINGIGGIGKSTIANYYLHSQKDKLDYYGFFEGLESFTVELKPRLKLKSTNEDELFMEALSTLSALEGEKLLVFDDVKNIEENQDKIEKILALKYSGYKILLTSREKIEEVEQYDLDVLTLDDAKELFNSIYLVEDEAVLEEILGYLDCHAFFVEMTAKTLKSKRTLTAEIVRDKFKNGEFPTITRKRKESFNKYLNELFSFDGLDDEEILMLKQFSVLPSIEIEFEFLEEIFNRKEDEEFEDILNYLTEKGWISSFENSYKLHQIIKEFILANYPSHFKEIETIINYFLKYEIKIEEWITIFLESVANFCIQYSMEDKKVGNLYYLLGRKYYDDLANMRKAEIYLNNAKKLDIAVEDVIDIYHRLGCINNNLDYLNKALSHYIQEGNEEQKAICLDDIGTVYWKRNKFNKALVYFEKSLDLLKENNFRGRAINYNQQSLVYKNKDKICKAFKYQLKAIKAIKKAREEDDSKLNKKEEAQLINNLGELYMDKTEQYPKAFKYLREALDLREKILYAGHERFGESYDNIAIIFEKKNDLPEAYEYQLEAIKIWEESPPEKDSYLEEAKERLEDIKKRLEFLN